MAGSATQAPQIRAFTSQMALDAIDRLPEEAGRRIREGAGDTTTLRDSLQIGWVPFEDHLRVLDSAQRVLGAEEYRRFTRQLMLGYLERPVLRGLFETVRRVLGVTPQSLAKWSPHAWEALFKRCGKLANEPQDRATLARVRLSGCPRECLTSGSFFESLAGSFEAIFPITKKAGAVQVVDVDLAAGGCVFAIEWVA